MWEDQGGYVSATLISSCVALVESTVGKMLQIPFRIEEIPSLAPDHGAEVISQLFETKWPKPSENSMHPIRTTLLRCFWKDFVSTTFLAVIRLCFMCMGPVLLQQFGAFSSDKGNSPYGGFYLVAALLVAKIMEVLCSHQFNFQNVGIPGLAAYFGFEYFVCCCPDSSKAKLRGFQYVRMMLAIEDESSEKTESYKEETDNDSSGGEAV
ncbi:hypothetical protein IFM89_010098 [Coptis chinensis]|uniref:Uncharacterized protein n=1 Tax=Coptis chinensis TaxID=261450 RepID=A0A835I243_9MAGN|nr:hypothetical protein IFM89_010098 [Coptis chinensis]